MIAASNSQALTHSERHGLCSKIKTIAETVMTSRQSGLDIVRTMDILGDDPLLIEMATRAYSSPRYSTDEYKRETIQEFGTEYYLDCIKNAK